MEDETYREYVANALHLLITDQRVGTSVKRYGEIVRSDEKKDDRTGEEILGEITGKLKARAKGRRKTDGGGD